MSMDNDSFIVDDDSSLTDVTASLADDTLSSIDDTDSPARENGSAAPGPAPAADNDTPVPALVISSTSKGKRVDHGNRPEVARQRVDDASKLNGKKRPASSERVLRQRPTKIAK